MSKCGTKNSSGMKKYVHAYGNGAGFNGLYIFSQYF